MRVRDAGTRCCASLARPRVVLGAFCAGLASGLLLRLLDVTPGGDTRRAWRGRLALAVARVAVRYGVGLLRER